MQNFGVDGMWEGTVMKVKQKDKCLLHLVRYMVYGTVDGIWYGSLIILQCVCDVPALVR